MSSRDPQPKAAVVQFPVPPVQKEVRVACSPEEAFDRFTRDIHVWWPRATHSIGGEKVILVAIEPHIGGRVFERLQDGSEHLWGSVLTWEPPGRLAFTWHVGRQPSDILAVELRFTALPGGTTQVLLVHSGWEGLGQDGATLRDEYDSGWNHVFLELYAAHAGVMDPGRSRPAGPKET